MTRGRECEVQLRLSGTSVAVGAECARRVRPLVCYSRTAFAENHGQIRGRRGQECLGHFNPGGRKHGLMAADGHHAGDLPNLHVPAGGELIVEVLNPAVTLEKGKANSLFGGQGTALVIHAGKDDYKTDPTGDAGGRIACGVVE